VGAAAAAAPQQLQAIAPQQEHEGAAAGSAAPHHIGRGADEPRPSPLSARRRAGRPRVDCMYRTTDVGAKREQGLSRAQWCAKVGNVCHLVPLYTEASSIGERGATDRAARVLTDNRAARAHVAQARTAGTRCPMRDRELGLRVFLIL